MNVMNATSMSRMVVPFTALVAAAGVAIVFAVRQIHEEPPVDIKTATAAPVVPKPETAAREHGAAALAATQQQANDATAALAKPSPQRATSDDTPAFDVVRIEPTGDAVVAGRAAPGATVELLRNGDLHDHVVADESGQFAMVPRPLPPGTYDLTLRSRLPDGNEATSKQSVAVALEPTAKNRPMVALMTPDKPTVVLSQPTPAAPDTVAVEAVDVEPSGKVHVSGRARPGAAVKLYLNDSFVASATADADGRLAVTINEGVAPGSYHVRLDEVEHGSASVRARAEVPFNVPDTATTASVPAQTTPTDRHENAKASEPQVAAAGAAVVPDQSSPSAVVVPKVATITVSRGDSLWRISSHAFGAGTRYAVIYKANRQQIRNPDLIYPGQVLVVPK